MRRKKGTEQDVPAGAGHRITPEEVQQVEFRLAFRGYNEHDVDAFLDRITEDLSAYAAGDQSPGGTIAGGDDASADAQQIVARAQAEADEIVRRAREAAANIRASAAPAGSGDTRAAVAPFLNHEREFLQSLGSLVQSHAEEIKQMVMALRSRTDVSTGQATSPAAPQPPGELRAVAAETGSAQSSSQVEAAPVSEIRARLEAAGPPDVTLPEDEALEGPGEAPSVVVDSGTEPVYSTEGSPAGERRERSLRELFWGEE